MKKALILNPKDNVAVALKNIKKGEEVSIQLGNKHIVIKAQDDIPFGHKIAIKRIAKGKYVIKYGEIIGIAVRDIEIGCHVHIHNVKSLRGRPSEGD